MTTFRWYVLGLALLFGAYVAVEYYRPKPLDWTPTFQNKDKIPYGTYVLYDLLPDIMGVEKREVRTIRVPIYNQIEGEDEPDTDLAVDTAAVTVASDSTTWEKSDEVPEEVASADTTAATNTTATTAAEPQLAATDTTSTPPTMKITRPD
ncbi:hypothetical protein [Hymenobacter volaticus]|uniref:Uncharacterized protein n=1 Tax=Hymenobacter volaticus TaxID=2932254 RepID=A0ABY4G3W7_9BACT|nr:hypothetical protein [Hymenobacter volaticus]UOQ65229.1 hypothetical protein MUN86_16950 [Hymenobacter volaticus]